jgi:hypothetical protein
MRGGTQQRAPLPQPKPIEPNNYVTTATGSASIKCMSVQGQPVHPLIAALSRAVTEKWQELIFQQLAKVTIAGP